MSGYFEGFDVNKDEKVTLEEVRRILSEKRAALFLTELVSFWSPV